MLQKLTTGEQCGTAPADAAVVAVPLVLEAVAVA
jgi:hypothetical protein